jgi:hypothetical protein
MTASELTYFNCTGWWYDVESANLGGTTSDLQFRVISAFVAFYPRLPAGFTAQIANLDIGGGTGQPTSLAISPVLGRIYEGTLSTIDRTDTAGVTLLANSSVISSQIAAVSSAGLIYDVAFTDVVYAGAVQTLQNFAFTALTGSGTVCLTDPTLSRLTYAGPGA